MSFRCGACGSSVPGNIAACPSYGFQFGVLPPSTTPQPSEGPLTGTGHFLAYALLILAIPAFLESAYEMYGLTLARGQQMLFFSIIHTSGTVVLILLLVSWLSLTLLTIYSGIVTDLRYFSTSRCKDDFGRIFTAVFAVTLTHAVLLVTYERWAPLLRGHAT